MAPKIKNIIIFVTVAAVFFLIYLFVIKPSPEDAGLVSTPASLPDVNGVPLDTGMSEETSVVARDFLTLLLSVKNIKLESPIFSDPAFISLRDSSITLIPDGTEGRPNPFAQFGNDVVPAPITPPVVTPPAPTVPSTTTPPPASPKTN